MAAFSHIHAYEKREKMYAHTHLATQGNAKNIKSTIKIFNKLYLNQLKASFSIALMEEKIG